MFPENCSVDTKTSHPQSSCSGSGSAEISLKFIKFSDYPLSQIFAKIVIVNEVWLSFDFIESFREESGMGFHMQ
jgi:hypothetical protein